MRNNILNKFAINDLKTHQKDSIIMMITIFIVSMTVMLVSLLTPLITNERYVEYQKQNGNYTYVYNTVDIEYISLGTFKKSDFFINGEKRKLKDIPHCITYNCGSTYQHENMSALEGDYSILSLQLLEGRMPKQKNEIVVEKSVLDRWGYSHQINQYIKLLYTPEGQNNMKVGEFKVVGIIEENEHGIIVSQEMCQSNNYELYLKTKANETIDNNEELMLDPNYTSSDFVGAFDIAFTLTVIQMLIVLVSLAIIYGITLTSFEKKQKDYTLLRSIGATQRQIYYVVFLQSLLLSFMPIVISISIVYILSIVLPSLITLPVTLLLSPLDVIWNCTIILFIAIVSYLMPAKAATRKALTGNFEGQEFQYFYYRYKKLHNMRPLYLSWRQLISFKKKMIIKVLIITIITVTTMNVVEYTLFNQNDISLDTQTIEYDLHKKISYLEIENDFKNLNPYVQSMVSYNYISSETLMDKYSTRLADGLDESFYDIPSLYCVDSNLQKQYHLEDIQSGQIILTYTYINSKGINEDIKNITIMGHEYEVVQVVDKEDISVFLNQKDYNNYLKNNPETGYTRIELSFDNVHERTQALITYSQDFSRINQKYEVSLSDYNQEEVSVSQTDIQSLLLIGALAIIYIYQFIFELYKQKEDIGCYQLLGLTHKEIGSIYFFKSLITIMIGFIFGSIYYGLDIYYKYNALMEMEYIFHVNTSLIIIGVSFIVVMMILIISLLPLKGILKKDAFENKNTRE